MKITGLRTEVVEFPYDPPMGLSANNYLRTGSCVLVFLESDQGAVGEGLVYSFNGDRIKLYNDLVQSFAPLVIGQRPHPFRRDLRLRVGQYPHARTIRLCRKCSGRPRYGAVGFARKTCRTERRKHDRRLPNDHAGL